MDNTIKNDDLKQIKGIGPGIEAVLNNNGINTFKQLAETPCDDIKAILRKEGGVVAQHDPEPWIEQAKISLPDLRTEKVTDNEVVKKEAPTPIPHPKMSEEELKALVEKGEAAKSQQKEEVQTGYKANQVWGEKICRRLNKLAGKTEWFVMNFKDIFNHVKSANKKKVLKQDMNFILVAQQCPDSGNLTPVSNKEIAAALEEFLESKIGKRSVVTITSLSDIKKQQENTATMQNLTETVVRFLKTSQKKDIDLTKEKHNIPSFPYAPKANMPVLEE